jgi:hypothetical protein
MLKTLSQPKPKRLHGTKATKEHSTAKKSYFTGADLANSPIVGIWKDRTDIGDSTEFVREMREGEQQRGLRQ